MEAVPALVCFLVTAADVRILRIGAGAWCSAPRRGVAAGTKIGTPRARARSVRAAQTTVRRRRSEIRSQVAEQREAKYDREHDGSDFPEF